LLRGVIQKSKNILTRKQEGIVSAAAVMMVIILLTKGTGFIRSFLYAYIFGANRELDMFIAANTVPEMIVNLLIMGSVNAALIPVLLDAFDKKGETYSKKLIHSILSIFGFILILVSFVALLFSREVIEWSIRLANPENGFTLDQIEQMTVMLRYLLISPAILGVSNLITGVLHVYQRFIIPQLAPLLYNIGFIISIFIFVPSMGVSGLVAGVLMGSVFHLLIQLPLLRHLNISLKPSFDFKNIFIQRMGKLMAPRVLGLAATQVSLVVDRIIALGLIAGSASALFYAESLKVIPVSVFGLSIAAAAFPALSKEAAANKMKAFKSTFVRSVNIIIFFAAPITAIMFVLRVPIVRLVLGLGEGSEFTWEPTLMTAWILFFFTIGLAAETIMSLVIKAFYSLQDTKTPVIVSIFTIIFSITTSILFTNLFSHFDDFSFTQFFQDPVILWEWLFKRNGIGLPAVGGLALSGSLSVIIEVIVLIALLHRKIGGFSKKAFYNPMIKKLMIGIIMIISMYAIYSVWNSILNTTKTLNIFILTSSTSVAGFSIYIILAYLFDLPEVRLIEKGFDILMNTVQNWRKYIRISIHK